MQPWGIHHTCLTVSNMEESLRFYRDGLGLEVVHDVEEKGERLEKEVNLPGAHNRLVWLKTKNGDTLVELLQYFNPKGKEFPKDARCCDVGMPHISFLVNDIQSMYEKLKGLNVKFTHPPMEVGGTFEGAKTAYCYDPDGIIVEIFELPEGINKFY